MLWLIVLLTSQNAWECAHRCYNTAPVVTTLEKEMSEELNTERESDGVADSIAVTAVVAVIVFTLYLWLSGMPS